MTDSTAVTQALKKHRLGRLAMDVYEAESELFYNDHSGEIVEDDLLMGLMTLPKVIISSHQGVLHR